MTKDDFNDLLTTDFEFQYNGKNYFICPYNNGFSCGEYGTLEPEQFNSIDDVWRHFLLEGKPVKDVVDKIDW